jgi:hypothetical protein
LDCRRTIAEPIFRRRELKTQFEIAKLQREQAVVQFRQSVLQAITEVENALVHVDKLRQQEENCNRTGGHVASGCFLTHSSCFKSDLANYLEV